MATRLYGQDIQGPVEGLTRSFRAALFERLPHCAEIDHGLTPRQWARTLDRWGVFTDEYPGECFFHSGSRAVRFSEEESAVLLKMRHG